MSGFIWILVGAICVLATGLLDLGKRVGCLEAVTQSEADRIEETAKLVKERVG